MIGDEKPDERDDPCVLWLTPDKPANISVGRRRIADRLEASGFDVTLRGTTPRTVCQSLRKHEEYDAVLGTTRSGAFAGSLLKLLGTPFVVDHIDPIRQFADTNPQPLSIAVRAAENLAFRLADHTLYVYDEEHERVSRYARETTKTGLGVSYERFATPDPEIVAAANDRLHEAGVDADERLAIYVGGLEPIYHIQELLAAMDRLQEWTLVVLGTGSLAPAVEHAAGERENVVFLGTVAHESIPGYLHAADVGVSLVDDPHTLKVLEYAAAGLSVVQARGRAEARFGEYAEFCEPRPPEIAAAIEHAGEREGDDSFREYVARFDYERVAETYRAVLDEIVRK
ncbi:rhamnosyltransferase WsaF family glycosyltransferase [Halococcus sediminicola]|uniref:rhamnosyltransferase WsaF family glycosyltransferase n=1 Tax=Halococcus sediminicola TaxID=1264579 RepID=UPI000678A3E8|nr:glycosyltransferase [Halococcus sediminicola]